LVISAELKQGFTLLLATCPAPG